MKDSSAAQEIDVTVPESEDSGVRRKTTRTNPLWQLLLRDSPELEHMNDDEIRAMVNSSRGPGPYTSHFNIVARMAQ